LSFSFFLFFLLILSFFFLYKGKTKQNKKKTLKIFFKNCKLFFWNFTRRKREADDAVHEEGHAASASHLLPLQF